MCRSVLNGIVGFAGFGIRRPFYFDENLPPQLIRAWQVLDILLPLLCLLLFNVHQHALPGIFHYFYHNLLLFKTGVNLEAYDDG